MRRCEGAKAGDRGAPSPCLKGSYPIGFDKGTLFKKGVDDSELKTFALPVDDPHLSESPLLTFKEIVF
jgi:hypothetical protein